MEESLKSYEIGYLTKNEEGKGALTDHLARQGAEILFQSELKGLRLAYLMRHEESAYFGYVHFKIKPEFIGPLNDALKLDNEIMRFLIITPPFAKERRLETRPEPLPPKKSVRPITPPTEETTLSNDLLEEKLEEILNK